MAEAKARKYPPMTHDDLGAALTAALTSTWTDAARNLVVRLVCELFRIRLKYRLLLRRLRDLEEKLSAGATLLPEREAPRQNQILAFLAQRPGATVKMVAVDLYGTDDAEAANRARALLHHLRGKGKVQQADGGGWMLVPGTEERAAFKYVVVAVEEDGTVRIRPDAPSESLERMAMFEGLTPPYAGVVISVKRGWSTPSAGEGRA